jgi:predicted dehydrogenase
MTHDIAYAADYIRHGMGEVLAMRAWYCDSSYAYHRPVGADSQVFRRQIEGLADSVLTGAPLHGADVDDGLSVMRVLAAISRSSESGETVPVENFVGVI